MNYAEPSVEPDIPYIAGRIVSLILFPLVVYGVGFLVIRLVKKRKPTHKEKNILIIVGIVLAVLGALGQGIKGLSDQY